ncbi:MAG: hypothetical protein U5K38_06800 [Woeseiaceae bacterium]|nr:hypothetical protein [Woeseiaceae bacterium]
MSRFTPLEPGRSILRLLLHSLDIVTGRRAVRGRRAYLDGCVCGQD